MKSKKQEQLPLLKVFIAVSAKTAAKSSMLRRAVAAIQKRTARYSIIAVENPMDADVKFIVIADGTHYALRRIRELQLQPARI